MGVISDDLDLENWMANLPTKLRSLPLIHLAIPGSHDSMTSSITRRSALAPDAETFLRYLQFLGPLMRTVMARWARTQQLDMTQQLRSGIRYFDLRLATRPSANSPYFVHGLYGCNVTEPFKQLREFVDEHPKEVVILDCQHFYAFTDGDHRDFVRLIVSVFGNKLVPCTTRMDQLSLEYLTTEYDHQVIVVYRSDVARFGQPFLWPPACFPTPWPNTTSISSLISQLDRGISTRPPRRGFVSQFLLTPTTWFVCKNLFGTLKSHCVEPIEKDMIGWIGRNRAGPGGVNIVICDFIDLTSFRFPKLVIDLNYRLLVQSEKDSGTSHLTPVDS